MKKQLIIAFVLTSSLVFAQGHGGGHGGGMGAGGGAGVSHGPMS